MALFGAAWTVCSLRYLQGSGARSLTFYETVGERGIMMGDLDSEYPVFYAGKGSIFPVFHLFRHLLKHKNGRLIPCKSSMELIINGFALETPDGGMVFLSNMTHQIQEVKLAGISKFDVLQIINEDTVIPVGNNDLCEASYQGIDSTPLFIMLPYETRILSFNGKSFTG
jgi:hypothetical protein